MIRLNVFIQVEAANRAALLAEAKALVEKSLNDEGCVAYDVFEKLLPLILPPLTLRSM